jgi:dTDP-glucose 4,6-dehydratase
MKPLQNILVTGGAGFIGSHVIKHWVERYPACRVVNVDKLTYAGNLANLKEIEGKQNYLFIRADICDLMAMQDLLERYAIDGIIHLAAESHVDRSIADPFAFARTNVLGTLTLLQAAKQAWSGHYANKLFYHVSTDEVYGTLDASDSPFTEATRYDPHSPYSASKASADHFVRAFHDTHGLPVKISNCSNNYGPYQFPEKLIPLFINNVVHEKPLPVYGKGENVRDWLHVEDHVRAIDLIFHEGRVGHTYNIGGGNEWRNIDLIRTLVRVTDELLGRPAGASERLVTHVTDRAGHDARYAIDSRKLRQELGWAPSFSFEEGLRRTVRWYLDNPVWLSEVTSGDYQHYYAKMYDKR